MDVDGQFLFGFLTLMRSGGTNFELQGYPHLAFNWGPIGIMTFYNRKELARDYVSRRACRWFGGSEPRRL